MKKAIVFGLHKRAVTSACRYMLRSGDQALELGGGVGYFGFFVLPDVALLD